MMTYAHAAKEDYDMPSRITTTAQKQKSPPPDSIHGTGYNPTQGTKKPHTLRNNQEGKHRY